ncbi:carbohydrate ABC transporter membrane protein 2, CUT1 family [Alteribacillus persepolensis]|uniref:Carbohydrate ABC transporter membrane protein 2, CUT1 family n=1 Tax=Alteribacillus persepolensis TaxID=568899 RepID=A0A1G8GKN0_9BACI|nr:carbohydrate ABC transporter permease [Alteribacillus persepolensis]SDH94857.1 carbohydrate ABC transporter membrane protein 2, CUT1 family [Alteribacillus persepolensis]
MPQAKTGMKARRIREDALRYGMLFFICLVVLFPLYWMVITSFKTQRELFSGTQTFFPSNFTLTYYLDPLEGVLSTNSPFLGFFFNSMIVSFFSTMFCLIIGSLAAYSLARFEIKLNKNDRLSFFILTARMLPPIVIIVPMYLIMQQLGLLNTHWAMLIVYTGFNLPFVVWMMKAFFQEIPTELEESAMVDGDSRMKAFYKIILPLVGPGLVATSIFTIILTWNEFLFAMFLLNSADMMTLPPGIANFITQYETNWGSLTAAATLAVIPVVIFSFFVQKHLVKGMTLGAVKG